MSLNQSKKQDPLWREESLFSPAQHTPTGHIYIHCTCTCLKHLDICPQKLHTVSVSIDLIPDLKGQSRKALNTFLLSSSFILLVFTNFVQVFPNTN
jgi:hypothetical protein